MCTGARQLYGYMDAGVGLSLVMKFAHARPFAYPSHTLYCCSMPKDLAEQLRSSFSKVDRAAVSALPLSAKEVAQAAGVSSSSWEPAIRAAAGCARSTGRPAGQQESASSVHPAQPSAEERQQAAASAASYPVPRQGQVPPATLPQPCPEEQHQAAEAAAAAAAAAAADRMAQLLMVRCICVSRCWSTLMLAETARFALR